MSNQRTYAPKHPAREGWVLMPGRGQKFWHRLQPDWKLMCSNVSHPPLMPHEVVEWREEPSGRFDVCRLCRDEMQRIEIAAAKAKRQVKMRDQAVGTVSAAIRTPIPPSTPPPKPKQEPAVPTVLRVIEPVKQGRPRKDAQAKPEKRVNLTVRCSPDEHEVLEAIAAIDDVTKNDAACEAIALLEAVYTATGGNADREERLRVLIAALQLVKEFQA